MKIAIAGGTGFVGTALIEFLLQHHREPSIYILTRNPQKYKERRSLHYVGWLTAGSHPESVLEGIDVFINLAGESLNSGRWTDERKKRIVDSRVESVREMVRILAMLNKKPETVINASAIGFYGMSETASFSEESPSLGHDFLSETVRIWESEANRAEKYTSRMVYARFGVILGKHEGALPNIVLPYKLFAGGTIGSGRQWLSWIHIEDAVRALNHCIKNNSISGPINITSPHPERMKEFGKSVAHVLQRPHWLPVPAFMLKLFLGEMSTLVLAGQHVSPNKLLNSNFQFKNPHLTTALEDLLLGQ
ncbi:TIGR01777 family oxidoreductase [Peribacillus sp. SCS-155]|uniref:TIGR01777 family oxidoreductase n=1 Tax=Peribacillus sedimenti TaxID=3115297 RepID=UPI0039067427